MKLSAFTAAVFFLWPTNGASADSRLGTECLQGLAPVLIAGAFSGSTDCKQDRIAVSKVGDFRVAERSFSIFDYRYKKRPVCPECAIHGGQRVIVLRDGRYIGQYGVIDYRARTTIHGSDLILSPAADDGVEHEALTVVHFRAGGPPKRILFDGEPINFFR